MQFVYSNGSNTSDWPKGDFLPDIDVLTSSGQLSVSGSLLNGAVFVYGSPSVFQATGAIYVNGAKLADLTINPSTYLISSPSVAVSGGDDVEVRFEAKATIVSPFDNQVVIRHSCLLEVAGDGTVSFSPSSNAMPVPAWTALFGWLGGNGDFQWGQLFSSSDGASPYLEITTRLSGGGSEGSSSFSPSSTTTQTHTAAFDKGDVGAGSFEVILFQKGAASRPRQQMSWALLFRDADAVGSYGGSLPSGALLSQSKVSGAAQLDD